MRDYTNWLYTLGIILVICGLIWFNMHLKQEWNEQVEEVTQLIEQTRQTNAEIRETERLIKWYEERIKNHELEQEVFDDVIDRSIKY